MPIRNGPASGGNAWKMGLRLAILNSLLGVLFMVVIFGILGKGVFFSMFPIREFSLLYLAVLIISWVLFALRLPVCTPTETFKTALLGTLPLLGPSMLSYILKTQVKNTGNPANNSSGL
ncbi:hypothetical protein SY88_18900 [Clostridiales bacterium PH28_bin88]|nr:hypothetical protein SY88_18900 [Clostridiales bacterium PH28_bin88]